jgi:hypothetical protein
MRIYEQLWVAEDYKSAIANLCDDEVLRFPEINSSDVRIWSSYTVAEKFVKVCRFKRSIFSEAGIHPGTTDTYDIIFLKLKSYREKLNHLGTLGD